MIRSFAIALVTLVSLGLPQERAEAQNRGPGAGLDRQEMLQRIQRRFQDRLARELELDENQREVLIDVFAEFGEARSQLLPRRREIAREIRELMAGDRSDERAMELLEELRELRRQEADLLIEEENRLLEALSPAQVLRLQVLRDQFGDQIRRLGSPNGANGPGARGPGRPRAPRP